MNYNDQHTPDHTLQNRDGVIFCVDCQTLRHMAEIDEALELAVREGVMPPHEANAMTREEKENWYDRGFQKSKKEDEIPL